MQGDFKTIVVGIDFSSVSDKAARQAIALANKTGARLIFAHIYDDRSLIVDSTKYMSSLQEVWELYRKKILSKYVKNRPGAEVVVKAGDADRELIRLALKSKNALIMIGSSGKGLVEKKLIGSLAEKLILTSPVPVWIHRGSVTKYPGKVIVGIDILRATTKFLKKISKIRLAAPERAHFLYVYSSIQPFLDYAQWVIAEEKQKNDVRLAEKRFCKQYPKYKYKKVHGEIVNHLLRASKKADLLVMAPHNRLAVFSPIGRVATKVLRKIQKPVLIVP